MGNVDSEEQGFIKNEVSSQMVPGPFESSKNIEINKNIENYNTLGLFLIQKLMGFKQFILMVGIELVLFSKTIDRRMHLLMYLLSIQNLMYLFQVIRYLVRL